MQEQIVREMKKAFFDLIDKNFNCENPDYIWITELYQEIKNKLLAFLPNKNGKVYKLFEAATSFPYIESTRRIRPKEFAGDVMDDRYTFPNPFTVDCN